MPGTERLFACPTCSWTGVSVSDDDAVSSSDILSTIGEGILLTSPLPLTSISRGGAGKGDDLGTTGRWRECGRAA